MSAFTALNIDYGDLGGEIEVDNTKEIQIEEALKLYQAALKFHSEGPKFYQQAGDAYESLIASEIFYYPESLTEHQRDEDGYHTLSEETEADEHSTGPVIPSWNEDSAPNTLPQIIHLSYKNYGRLLLDELQLTIQKKHLSPSLDLQTSRQFQSDISRSIDFFVKSVDKDGSDLELWRRIAQLSMTLGSMRLSRYCWESALSERDRYLVFPGLEEQLARQNLKELLLRIGDSLPDTLFLPTKTSTHGRYSNKVQKFLGTISNQSGKLIPKLQLVDPACALDPVVHYSISSSQVNWSTVREAVLAHYEQSSDTSFESRPIEFVIEHDLSSGSMKDDVTKLDPSTSRTDSDSGRPAIISCELNGRVESTDPPAKRDDGVLDSTSINRKRSTDSAGFNDSVEGLRGRSKRLRARDLVDTSFHEDHSQTNDHQQALEEDFSRASEIDDGLFTSLSDILDHFGFDHAISAIFLRESVQYPQAEHISLAATIHDLIGTIREPELKYAQALLDNSGQLSKLSSGLSVDSLLKLHQADPVPSVSSPSFPLSNILEFCKSHAHRTLLPWKAAWEFIIFLLSPLSSHPGKVGGSHYLTSTWPDRLKKTVLDFLVTFDESFHSSFLDSLLLSPGTASRNQPLQLPDAAEVVQAIFELHLDRVSESAESNNIDSDLENIWRWQTISSQLVQEMDFRSPDATKILRLRLIWATSTLLRLDTDLDEQASLAYVEDLAASPLLDNTTFRLPNSRSMPVLSREAIDQEVRTARVRGTLHAICKLDAGLNSVEVINRLEPLLRTQPPSRLKTPLNADADYQFDHQLEDYGSVGPVQYTTEQQAMKAFIDSSSLMVRLSLYQRLAKAYDTIDYFHLEVFNHLRCLKLVITELKSPRHIALPPLERRMQTMIYLRVVHELLDEVLSFIADTQGNLFETLNHSHLRSFIPAIFDLCSILHSHVLLEDAIAVGQVQPVVREKPASATALKLTGFLHEIEVRSWVLLYTLFKEVVSQSPELLPVFEDSKLSLLNLLHESLGHRKICKADKNIFLRLLRDELLDSWPVGDSETQLIQVLKDMYNISFTCLELEDHTSDTLKYFDPLTHTVASKLVPFVVRVANSINIKDLLKSDIKESIDDIHGIIDGAQPHYDMNLNNELILKYLSGPVRPLALFQCMKGVGELETRAISHTDAPAAYAGWYFLMGNLSLQKFQIQNRHRTQPLPTEDLESAATCFLHDLEFSSDRWETWYRLAQTYENILTEMVSWSMEKVNSKHPDIVMRERMIVNCYTMAISGAMRSPDKSKEFSEKLASLYSEFGIRLYSSTRDPFSMQAFDFRDDEYRSFSGPTVGLYQFKPFTPLDTSTAWKLGCAFFKKAISLCSSDWQNCHMLSKCQWKLFNHDCGEVDFMDAIDSIIEAINLAPAKSRKDSTVEPHYRLLSVVHKLVKRDELLIPEALAILRSSHYSDQLPTPSDRDEWEGYVLDFLKKLRSSEKSGWHHRMTSMAAHVVYDDCESEVAAMGAKHELMQQMFTKTMIIQVWKPEYQRPGRHFVYTTRYTRFMTSLLSRLGDKPNLEQLLKRFRKKTNDYYQHTALWQDCATAYVRVLRRYGKIPESHEDTIFKNLPIDDWNSRSAALDEWCHAPGSSSPILDLLRDTLEFKKLNNGLMKPTLIDDLLGDAYALLYSIVGAQLTLPATPAATVDSQVQPTQSSTESTAKPRTKGVGRREVHKKAEMAATKASGSATVNSNEGTGSGEVKPGGPIIFPPLYKEPAGVNLPPGRIVDIDSDSSLSELDDYSDDDATFQELSALTLGCSVTAAAPIFPGLGIDGDAALIGSDAATSHTFEANDTDADMTDLTRDGGTEVVVLE